MERQPAVRLRPIEGCAIAYDSPSHVTQRTDLL
jgi:hypothetical protein